MDHELAARTALVIELDDGPESLRRRARDDELLAAQWLTALSTHDPLASRFEREVGPRMGDHGSGGTSRFEQPGPKSLAINQAGSPNVKPARDPGTEKEEPAGERFGLEPVESFGTSGPGPSGQV